MLVEVGTVLLEVMVKLVETVIGVVVEVMEEVERVLVGIVSVLVVEVGRVLLGIGSVLVVKEEVPVEAVEVLIAVGKVLIEVVVLLVKVIKVLVEAVVVGVFVIGLVDVVAVELTLVASCGILVDVDNAEDVMVVGAVLAEVAVGMIEDATVLVVAVVGVLAWVVGFPDNVVGLHVVDLVKLGVATVACQVGRVCFVGLCLRCLLLR